MNKSTDLRFGCPYCGASGGELCINQQHALDMDVVHGERMLFAAVHDRTLSA